jgi:aminomethyltransferase
MAAERTTPLYDVHLRLGARMVPFAGFEMPVQYDGILAEHQRCRTAVALFDVSHMGEVRVRGPEAVAAVNRLITNDIGKLADGRAQYTALCAPDGTIVDDLICYRLAADEVLICTNAANRETDLAHLREHLRGDAVIVDEGDQWAQIAVQGPRAPTLVGRLFGEAIAALRPFRIVAAEFAGVACYVSTTGYTGEPGVEVYIQSAGAVALWEALQARGADLGVGPCGLGARDTLRLEMAYCLYGNDIDRTTTPLEANLGWVTKLSKGDFVGRDALLAQQAAGVPRRLVGLEVFDRGIPRPGYAVLHEGAEVGRVTSGTKSPSTGRAIGLAYVPTALAAPGTALSVDCRGKAKPAVVVATPFYTQA